MRLVDISAAGQSWETMIWKWSQEEKSKLRGTSTKFSVSRCRCLSNQAANATCRNSPGLAGVKALRSFLATEKVETWGRQHHCSVLTARSQEAAQNKHHHIVPSLVKYMLSSIHRLSSRVETAIATFGLDSTSASAPSTTDVGL